jgi:hypothetical protein
VLILTALGLYVLWRICRKTRSGNASVIPIIIESIALVLIVIWRTVSTTIRSSRF